jgi:hypothetical protein
VRRFFSLSLARIPTRRLSVFPSLPRYAPGIAISKTMA